jgi:hypothetical protein
MARDSISRRRRNAVPPFIKNVRLQESKRKHIVRELLWEARQCETTARRARRLAEQISTVEALRDRDLLCRIVNFGDQVRYWVGELFGLKCPEGCDEDRRMFLIDKLLGIELQAAPIAASKPTQLKDPVAAARRIIAEARRAGELDEIDWTNSPKNERERAIRAAVLKAIEEESLSEWHQPSYFWVDDLKNLAPDAEEIGEDLYDEIERVTKLADEAFAEDNRQRRRKFTERAQREIDGGETP